MTKTTPKKRPPKADVWRPKFLEALREFGVVSYAAEIAGVNRTAAYNAKSNSAEFALQWDEALAVATDAMEFEARRRAVRGVRRTKFYKGIPLMTALIGGDGLPVFDDDGNPVLVPYTEHEYSDTLLIFLLKAHRPEKYRERYDVTSDGSAVQQIVYIKENRGESADGS